MHSFIFNHIFLITLFNSQQQSHPMPLAKETQHESEDLMTFSPSPAPLEEDLENDESTENDHDKALVESDFEEEEDVLEGVQFNTRHF